MVYGNGNDLGNNFSRFAHQNSVSDGKLFFVDEILVVQNRAADGRSGEKDWFKDGGRSQCARSADVDFNVQQFGFFFLRGIFISNRPFWVFLRDAQSAAIVEAVDLHYRTVGVKGIGGTFCTDSHNLLPYFFNIFERAIGRGYGKAEGFEHIQRLHMGFRVNALCLLKVEYENIQSTRSGHACLLLPQRACRGVAWILERHFSVALVSGGQLRKYRPRHIHFTAHL